MKEYCHFLIVETGFEGINEILYFTEDAVEVVKKIEEYRTKKVEDEIKMNKELNKDCEREGSELRWPTELAPEQEQSLKDFICVMAWNGKKFKCVCSKLGVKPSQTMWR